jgi:RNA polymerase sigma factor (sigma-70 family)
MANERKHTTADHSRLTSEHIALLVTRAADGEQAAWNALIDEFGGLVWATTRAHRLSSTDAADVFQNTWMRLVENLDRIQDPARLGRWLATTARRESLTVIRHARRMIPRSDDLPDLASDAPHPVQRLIREHDATAVQTALARLGPRDRALLRMLAAEPTPSYAEIGAALGMAIGSIGPTRARALNRLRREAKQGRPDAASTAGIQRDPRDRRRQRGRARRVRGNRGRR